jgi:hypothetical protein
MPIAKRRTKTTWLFFAFTLIVVGMVMLWFSGALT